ncbi:dynamin family protein [Pseudobacillus sp. 179-B 2D1 NHS]|uniref:dynamin family protein n=1 Tax=Pseudobacillus sp. 179-B 2D1 NHS TaxID=3374292 RepID=UPI00387A1F82
MSVATIQQSMPQVISKTVGLFEIFQQAGDEERAGKAKLFLKKLHDEEFIVAFCGHFSAGKSTMINELTGENLLPSSPIPTSANLVKIHHAPEDFAKVYYKEKQPLLFKAPYNFDRVKEFCKNGEEVEAIEIGHSGSNLPAEVTVMDTPGVDSTDDAHRISTESALHLADMVFYVMDYNHVQSELNFIYTKELLAHGVKLYLIINQIDKHREEELSFEEFKQSVYTSFAAWGVKPEKFFFTSLRERSLPGNDFQEVKDLIQESMADREKLALRSAETMMNRLVSEHLAWLKEAQAEKKEQLLNVLGDQWDETEIVEKEQQAKEQLDSRDAKALVRQWEEEREKVLQNAYLMPASTRELAREFLEAVQPGFKVGMLFSKKKTEEERQRRLERFLSDLKEKAETQLEWHLRQQLGSWLKSSGLNDDELQLEAEELAVSVDEQLISNTVKPGARATGDYVLTYTDDLASQLKKNARSLTEEIKEKAAARMETRFAAERQELQARWSTWHEKLEAIQQLASLEAAVDNRQKAIRRLLAEEPLSLPAQYEAFVHQWAEQQNKVTVFNEDLAVELTAAPAEKKPEIKENVSAPVEKPAATVGKTAERLKKMSGQLAGIPGFQRFIDGLKQKADRLEQRKYTIALFGAFSAGKSSFANAMLGEKVLPVSPNPTTAAVNRIHPPDEKNRHRTAAVHLKTEKQMLIDLQQSLQFFNQSVQSLDDAYKAIPGVLQNNGGEGRENIHLSFLNAFYEGYKEYKDHLGQTLSVDLPAFQGFVANEKQSCFVESIDLYYDCEFTRQGVTLVDTPGADSINARHTGVAFEYIKNSDAILFVTYYNHAFSKADREFLIQLGRVKDAFELDKMFFIVNAIDLASSDEEVEDVINYVKEQLLQYGIRFPRIHGVSSLQAIQEIERGELDHPYSNLRPFKQEFQQFLEGDLAEMAIQSAEAEWNRGLEQLRQLIATAKENRENREQKKEELESQLNEISSYIKNETAQVIKKRMIQEMDELVFYLKQRVFYRFSDFFKESFNPASLNGSRPIKPALSEAMKELLEAVGYDLAQEMRATSLRSEKQAHKLLAEKYEALKLHCQSIQPQLQFSAMEWPSKETPEFPAAFQEMAPEAFGDALSLFKNAKSFFEKNEKQLMQEALHNRLSELADSYLAAEKEKLSKWALEEAVEGMDIMKETAASDVEEQFTAWLQVLNAAENIEEWEHILVELERP